MHHVSSISPVGRVTQYIKGHVKAKLHSHELKFQTKPSMKHQTFNFFIFKM